MYYSDASEWEGWGQRSLATPSAPAVDDPLAGALPAAPTHNFLLSRFASAAEAFEREWGSLPHVPVPAGATLAPGASGPAVDALRARLGLPAGGGFDASLAQRIAEYRRAHGLPPGSQADAALIASLNRGHAAYARIIELNRRRLGEFPADPGNRFVLVDAAEQRLYMYEGQSPVGSMKVIVGKASDQTPMLAGLISYTEINPYWNVPPDLVQKTYAGRVIRGGRNYLDTRGFEAMSGWDDSAAPLPYAAVDWQAVAAGKVSIRLRQKPGPGNGMGRIKFMFPNKFGVYLHDTPSVALFNESQRTLSAGCVRLEKPWELANWLYRQPMGWQGRPNAQQVNLPEPVPVYLTYLTAVPSGSGFTFRDDIYNRDHTMPAEAPVAPLRPAR